jgi:hypothetical protein
VIKEKNMVELVAIDLNSPQDEVVKQVN